MEYNRSEGSSVLPAKSQHDWYLIMSRWSEKILLGNLSGAQRKQAEGRGDNWSAAVIQVARERGII